MKKLKIFRYYLVAISNILFGTPIFLILLLVNLFKKIRFTRLYSSRIGHITYNVDNYIYHKKKNNNLELTIFICEKIISNKDIYSRWNKVDNILLTNHFLMKNLIGFLEKFISESKFIIPFNKLHYDFSLTSCSKPNLWIDNKNNIKIEKYFSSLGVKKPYICLHNRDSSYLNKKPGVRDNNYSDFRNFKFSSFSKSIKLIENKNIQSIRVGEIVEDESFHYSDSFISATGKDLSNKHIIDLINNSEFLVSAASGIAQVSRVIRKPQLLINFTPFMINESFHAHSAKSILVPKKIQDLNSNRLLSLKEISDLPYDIHNMRHFFEDRNLIIIDNTEDEILDAIKEMILHVRDLWVDDEQQSELQSKFWKSFENFEHYNELRYKLQSKISSSFLKNNPSLVE